MTPAAAVDESPIRPVPAELSRSHLIGIGGTGMSGLARILLARGAHVSGSDAKDSRAVLALRTLGARIAIGQDAANLEQLEGGPTTVLTTSAIRDTNVELAEARRLGLPILHRAAALAALMEGYRTACVAGTAGKTSTTSMLTVALQHCGIDPSFAVGGDLAVSGSNAHTGRGDVFVAEADESDGSFVHFCPRLAVVTNVEADHLDHHGTTAAYVAVFEHFVDRIAPGGALIVNADDPGAARLADRAAARGVTVRPYGAAVTEPGGARIVGYRPDGSAGVAELELPEDIGDAARVPGEPPRQVSLRVSVPGEHMAANATAALLAGLELGAPLDGLLAGLAGFGGVRRRFEFVGGAHGVRVYDDYAHHPTKVAAALRGARQVTDGGRLVVAFQPHLYSRTRDFAAEFGAALGCADVVLVLDVYGAREDPVPGISGELIAREVPLPADRVHYEPSWEAVPRRLAALARPGDVVVTMGAGDITNLGPEVVAELDRRSGVAATGAV